MNRPKKETDGIQVADEIKHLKEMEIWYIKALRGLNLECSRLETEMDRIKKDKNVHDLKSEHEHLKQLEVWYIKALKGLNAMCSGLEEEINRLKSENVRLKEWTKRVSLEEELSSAEKRLARFLNNAGDPTKTLLKAILFSENDLGLDVERITAVLPTAFPCRNGSHPRRHRDVHKRAREKRHPENGRHETHDTKSHEKIPTNARTRRAGRRIRSKGGDGRGRCNHRSL